MAKKSKTTNLAKYSKEDLIWIINYFAKWHGDFYIERAISELEYKKDTDRIHEAEKYSKISNEKRIAYYDLLAPYDGKPWSSIPYEVLCKAEKLIKAAQAADEKYMKLMGFGRK